MNLEWPTIRDLVAAHETQIAEHGGSAGIRDAGLLESAVARPQNAYAYGDPPPDVPSLAALCAIAIVRNHPFVDGNKRVGLIALELFLKLNGYRFDASDAECVVNVLELAAGGLTDDEFTAWVRENAQPETSR